MRGSIQTDLRCVVCGRRLKSKEPMGLFCPSHPETIHEGRCRVMFDNVTTRCDTYREAYKILTRKRAEVDAGTYDARDYKIKAKPLAFNSLVDEWLEIKKQVLNQKTWRSMAAAMAHARNEWGEANIKSITYAHIEDFLMKRDCKSKTKWNLLNFLKQFWKWVEDRHDITPIKKWPALGPVEMEFRKTLPLTTQQRIIDDIRQHEPFRVWLGVSWQAQYLIRPRELRDINEECVDRDRGLIILLRPKGRKPEIIKLEPKDLEIIRGLPVHEDGSAPFFRHEGGIPGAPVGERFGENQFRRAWTRACGRLGIKGVALYAGTKHTTMTALGQHGLSLETIKLLSRHKTSVAALRYAQMSQNYGVRDEVLASLSEDGSDNGLTMESGQVEIRKPLVLQ